ncbi:MAG: tetratricopeptide repeat protein [Methylophilaceae bacterium]|nr:tetratricopeptide repeat protein [Methylophilaceae bacterium]
MQPNIHSTPLNAFDLNLLPADARQTDSDAFKLAVMSHYAKLHADKGETTLVIVENEDITVFSWEGTVEPMDYVLELLNSGRFIDAVRLLRSITFSQPDNTPAFFNLGIANLESGNFDEAVINLEKAVELDPSLSDAWFGIGMGKLKQEDTAAAIDALIMAVKTDPENSYAQRNLAGLLNKEGRFEESLSHYLAVSEKLPNDPQVIFGVAQCLEIIEGEGNLEKADVLYAKLIKDFPALRATEFAGEARARIAEKLGKKSS